MTDQPTAPAAPAKGMLGGLLKGRAGEPAKGDGQEGGRVRTGMGYWNTAVFVTGFASDIATPIAKWSLPILVLFLIATAAAAYFAFIRKMRFAQQMVGTLGLGALVFAVLVVSQMATPGGLGKERGVIAAIAPPIAAVQTAVLPMSPVEKELLILSTQINTGDAEARSAAARAAFTDPEQDKAIRRAKLERILRNDDVNIQQAGLVQALADRAGAPLSIIPAENAPEGDLRTQLIGAQVAFQRVNVETGALYGVFSGGTGGNRQMDGSVANGRVIVNTQYARPNWKNGLVLDLRIDKDFKLVGTAQTPEDKPINIEMPLL